MRRFVLSWGLALVLVAGVFVPAAVGQGGGGDVLKAIPSNAWAVLVLRNASDLDQKLMGVSQQLNLPPMSMLQMAKMSIGLVQGVNDNGALAVVMMPNPAIMVDQTQSLAVLIPCQDYAGLTQMMQPEDAGNGLSKVMVAGQPSDIAQYGTYAVVGPNPNAVQAILAAKDGPGIAATWSAHQKKRYSEDDMTLLVNIDAIISDPALGGMITMMMMQGGSPEAAEELKQYAAASVGLRVGKDGLRLGFYLGAKPDTELAKYYASSKPTSDCLLTGLPNDKYLMAFGLRDSEAVWTHSAEKTKKSMENPMQAAAMQADPEQMKKLTGIIVGMLGDMRGVSASVSALPGGSDGMLGMAKVVTVSGGAAEKCKQVTEIMQVMGSMLPVPELQQVLKNIKYSAGVETIAGVSVDHLTMHLDKMEGVSEDDFRKMQKIVGKDGLAIRLAAIDDKHMAATLGGGSTRMEQVIGLVKSGGTPLGANEGVKKSAAMLSSERVLEGYLATDTLMKSLVEISKVVEEPMEVPFPIPDVPTPLAMVGMPGGDRGMQVDVAIPMPLITTIKDVAMSAAGGGQGGPGGPGAAAPPEEQVD